MTNKKPEYPVSGLHKKMQSTPMTTIASHTSVTGNPLQKMNQQKVLRKVIEVSSDELDDRVRFHRFGQ